MCPVMHCGPPRHGHMQPQVSVLLPASCVLVKSSCLSGPYLLRLCNWKLRIDSSRPFHGGFDSAAREAYSNRPQDDLAEQRRGELHTLVSFGYSGDGHSKSKSELNMWSET